MPSGPCQAVTTKPPFQPVSRIFMGCQSVPRRCMHSAQADWRWCAAPLNTQNLSVARSAHATKVDGALNDHTRIITGCLRSVPALVAYALYPRTYSRFYREPSLPNCAGKNSRATTSPKSCSRWKSSLENANPCRTSTRPPEIAFPSPPFPTKQQIWPKPDSYFWSPI